MRKNIIAISLLVALTLGFTTEFKQIESTPKENDLLAVYWQDDNGDYSLCPLPEFPYYHDFKLNTEKSSCQNGGLLSQDRNTGEISLSTSQEEKCTLYFDVIYRYTVTYTDGFDDIEIFEDKSYEVEKGNPIPDYGDEIPTRNGYTFIGWRTGDNQDIPETVTADITLIATWTKL